MICDDDDGDDDHDDHDDDHDHDDDNDDHDHDEENVVARERISQARILDLEATAEQESRVNMSSRVGRKKMRGSFFFIY